MIADLTDDDVETLAKCDPFEFWSAQ